MYVQVILTKGILQFTDVALEKAAEQLRCILDVLLHPASEPTSYILHMSLEMLAFTISRHPLVHTAVMLPPALLGEGSVSDKVLDQAVMESEVRACVCVRVYVCVFLVCVCVCSCTCFTWFLLNLIGWHFLYTMHIKLPCKFCACVNHFKFTHGKLCIHVFREIISVMVHVFACTYVLISRTYYMFFIDFAPAHAEVQPHWLAQPSPV